MTLAAGMTPEAAYCAATPAEHRRRLGQVFTPPDCAALMADWVAGAVPGPVLDPAAGTGALLRAMAARDPDRPRLGIEIDPAVLEAARAGLEGRGIACALRQGDFLQTAAEPVAGIIANPPYLRPALGSTLRAQLPQVGARHGVTLSGLANAYVAFTLEAAARLVPGGRAAILLPGDWVNANSAGPLRDWLLDRGLLRRIVQISAERLVFDRVLSTAGLIFLERPLAGAAGPEAVETVFLPADCPLPGPGQDWPRAAVRGRIAVGDLACARKWEPLLRGAAPGMPAGFVPLGQLATSRRGIATGANEFFHLSLAQARGLGLAPANLLPCVAKTADVRGLVFGAGEYEQLARSDRPSVLFAPRGALSAAEATYVASGEAQGLDRRYLTRNRNPWYAPERLWRAPIWAASFGRGPMRFVLNAAGVWQLTAFHGIFPRDEGLAPALTACLNSAPVQALIEARARHHARGLKKLEPRDLLEIPVPDLGRVAPGRIAALADLLGQGGARAERALVQEVEAAAAEVAQQGGESDETSALGRGRGRETGTAGR